MEVDKFVFKQSVDALVNYIKNNNIQSLILGISGGIDSTVCAAICYEASKQTGIPLIGRSLPTKYNKAGETTTANLVGKAFCDDFQTFSIGDMYENILDGMTETYDHQTPLANGNIQARLRMIYLYNLASIHKGMVIDTDNLTEHYLGYWTLHGDVGDYKPIGNLWKTEVFGLAKWLHNHYTTSLINTFNFKKPSTTDLTNKANAIAKSLALKPTAGLGITDSDLEELGAESYNQVDDILQEIIAWKELELKRGNYPTTVEEQKRAFLEEQQMLDTPIEIIKNVATRHFNSEFKRR